MSKCEAKRGLFTLYDCHRHASFQCQSCGRSVCKEHGDPKCNTCFECLAQAEQANVARLAPYKTRNGLLKRRRNKKGQVNHFGKSLDKYYDQYDITSFDIALKSAKELSDCPDSLYFDS